MEMVVDLGPGRRRAELAWVSTSCRQTLEFWARWAPHGPGRGYLVRLRADGTPYDTTQHLVASSRFVVTFATGAEIFQSDSLRVHAQAALDFLRAAYRDPDYGGYYWSLGGDGGTDHRKVLYGHAFVLLAAANAVRTGLDGGEELLSDITTTLDRRFSPDGPLAAPGYTSREWSSPSPVRVQNPNMHLCEALIAAFEANGNQALLSRAVGIASLLARDLAEATPHGVVWENFDRDWRPLPATATGQLDSSTMESGFNVIPGHQAEWAKLLGILFRHTAQAWLVERAKELYDLAWKFGWDRSDQGFHLFLDDDLRPPTGDAPAAHAQVFGNLKSYWSPPEAIGAAAVLESLTGEDRYAADRQVLWEYCRTHMIDEDRGGWFKEPAVGRKPAHAAKGDMFDPDYHALGGCFETLRSLDGSPKVEET
jgi:mannose/cellobiose epimerase-like protein (N-acyl-D-glucosamine 2-epimerase family)